MLPWKNTRGTISSPKWPIPSPRPRGVPSLQRAKPEIGVNRHPPASSPYVRWPPTLHPPLLHNKSPRHADATSPRDVTSPRDARTARRDEGAMGDRGAVGRLLLPPAAPRLPDGGACGGGGGSGGGGGGRVIRRG
ncbi:unnamed protein product [Lampetra fluviatilis]